MTDTAERLQQAFANHGSFAQAVAAADATTTDTAAADATTTDTAAGMFGGATVDSTSNSAVSTDESEHWVSATTAFQAWVRATPQHEGAVFDVTARVPLLSDVTADDVAEVVEDGWAETFERRVVDVGGVTRHDHDFDPTVYRDGGIVVRFSFVDRNVHRGVDDAGALITFVEGTFMQGVIPGYDYVEPVSDLLAAASTRASGDAR